MKIAAILLLSFLAVSSGHAKDYTIEDSFIISLPDQSSAKERPPGAIPNTGYPKVTGPGFTFQTYWWLWVKPEEDIMAVPAIWVQKRDYKRVTDIAPFSTSSGLKGVRFHTVITSQDRPDFHSEMLLLRDQKNQVVLFQMTGAPNLVEDAFKSIKYR